jgi:Fe-S-cluster-containing hydrogenase component 2
MSVKKRLEIGRNINREKEGKMTKKLLVKPEECVACKTCELVCSFEHYQKFNPLLAAVTVYDYPEDVITVPVMCLQCDEAACEQVCPVGALKRNDQGVVVHDSDRCIVCKLCVQACPLGNIAYQPSTQKVFKCDLCGGSPQCATWCHTGAITYIDAVDDTAKKRAVADSLKNALAEEVA